MPNCTKYSYPSYSCSGILVHVRSEWLTSRSFDCSLASVMELPPTDEDLSSATKTKVHHTHSIYITRGSWLRTARARSKWACDAQGSEGRKHWPVSETQRCIGGAVLHLAAWASGYGTAQLWLQVAYILLCNFQSESDHCKQQISAFATIGPDGQWAGLLDQETSRWRVFTVCS